MKEFIIRLEATPDYVLWQISKIIDCIKLGRSKYIVHQDFIGEGAVKWFKENDFGVAYDGDLGEYTITWNKKHRRQWKKKGTYRQ